MIRPQSPAACVALMLILGQSAFAGPGASGTTTFSDSTSIVDTTSIADNTAVADTTASARRSSVAITSDIDSALVFLDSVFVGRTPFKTDSLRPGIHVLKISHPRVESWHGGIFTDTLRLEPGETKTLRYDVRTYVSVTSVPPGADVYVDDSLAGRTPFLVHPSLLRQDLHLAVKKDGFESVAMNASDLTGSVFQIALRGGWQKPPAEESPYFNAHPGLSSRQLGLYLSGGLSVVAGVAAAYCKIAADDRQAAYLESGNASLLTERKRLDTWAGISFAVTQVGLAVFSYLLISE